ncbi:thioredoxin domain-containing protein 3-like isoform X1 [Daphnia carinata]|uniref:thioredoxin domain-containing protein 3-like isoform X1 n=2 Tax=Daphnia carinata TaxID=120202 RepID=UPI00257993BB|nr:thioredoxin domain-containing protein 3-like isoform X1 [Daphnia carinata]
MADMSVFVPKKMAEWERKVDHLIWQIEVASDEKWEELVKLRGLVVVDVYSEWCGPCTAMANYLKEIKLLLGDDLLHCALAKSDKISQLAKFRGRSEPTWLFLAGGEPVVLIRGANAPLIRKTLLEELQREKEVLEGTRQRASLSWDSFDLPVFKPDTEKNNKIVLTTAPDNWWELDGLTLQGSYHLITDKLFAALTKRNLKIVAQSAVRLNQKDCLILWFPSSVDYFSLTEWFDATIETLIAEVEPKIVLEEEIVEELSEKTEGLELAEKSLESEVKPTDIELNSEEPEYQPIEFRLITDPDERDALVKRLEKELKDSIDSESLRVEEDDGQIVENV